LRYKLLGKSGLRVSEICLGTMTFGEDWGWGAPKEESEKILRVFADSGGNFIDTSGSMRMAGVISLIRQSITRTGLVRSFWASSSRETGTVL